ncbi:MAG TPA: VWA domain-containing protein [Thermoanaerobaculia bacterium]|jgi:VWFA-related protein|nr:VWA domain-containing protein [Thermoanaerobaculia bacterium]
MRHRPQLILAALLGLLAVFSPFSTIAQTAPSGSTDREPAVFGELIEVRVVNVEVVVTDKKGNRVPDLTKNDFRLKVDGKVVPIEYFTEVRGGQAIVASAASAEQNAPVPGLAGLAPGSDVGTSYLVFIDDFFSVAAQRDKVIRSLKDNLSRLGPQDRMAIVAFDGKSVDMLSTWSTSANALSRAFDQALVRRAHGLERVSELRSFETTRRQVTGFFGDRDNRLNTRLEIDELQYAQSLAQKVERSVSAAVTTLRGFASPPGRKVMILLSGGWPYAPADYAINDPNRPVSERDVPEGEKLFEPLSDTANLLGYTVYPVDVPGLEGSVTDASQEGPAPATSALNLRENQLHDSLDFIARQTGGTPLLNSNAVKALERATTDTRSFYWLGFTPNRQGDDIRHRIKVEAARPGLTVRFRDSFKDLSKSTEVSLMVESALFFGNPPGSESMPVQVGAVKPAGKKNKEIGVPLSIAIPTDAITMLQIDGKYRAQLELRAAAVDEKGYRSDVPVTPLTVTTATAPKPGGFLRYDTTLKLRKIRQKLVLSIFDPASGRLLAAQVEITPPK